jgi:anti-sigma-K factor RskA
MEDEMLHEQLAAYALDALDDDERVEFEHHLAACERCRADLPGLRNAASALAEDVDPVAPPPELRQRVLDEARADRPNVVPLKTRRAAQPLVWVAGVAAAAAVALAVWGGLEHRSLDRERSARRAAERALAVLGDRQATLAALNGGDGTLAVASDGRGVLTVAGLPTAPSGKTYEAWVIPNGAAPKRAGLFRGGRTTTVVLGPRVPRGGVVAVTLEPSGGVDAPTTKPFISAARA